MIVVTGESPIDTMHHGSTRRICFKGKGLSTESTVLHLIGVKLLHVLYERIQLCVNVGFRATVDWEKVDESHHFSLLQGL